MKYQITLPDDLSIELKTTAARLRIPLAQFIRETVVERLRRERQEGQPNSSSWLDELAARNSSTETDLSTRVDEIVYG